MSIVYWAIDQLKPDLANPRRHSSKQIRQIANSIETFGFNVPILIDRDGKVIAGHGRLLACRLLGITEVPTRCLDHLTPAQARAFMSIRSSASGRRCHSILADVRSIIVGK
jgi:ParB-like chromosome segregation protein Spo0J